MVSLLCRTPQGLEIHNLAATTAFQPNMCMTLSTNSLVENFQVNASGQFCGVAEMTGPVDFTQSVEYWQQDKWNGRFTVKWHIIKDIPNCQFRHIILENNDNKPVTNSRDTQEVNALPPDIPYQNPKPLPWYAAVVHLMY